MHLLSDLPFEIQDQIWRKALVYDRPLQCNGPRGHGTTTQLFVSKRLRKEYTPVFWRENIFVIDLDKPAKYVQHNQNTGTYRKDKLKDLFGIPDDNGEHVRNVTFRTNSRKRFDHAVRIRPLFLGILPNIVYLNLDIDLIRAEDSMVTGLCDLWQSFGKPATAVLKYIRIVRLTILGCWPSSWGTYQRTCMFPYNKHIHGLISGAPMPMTLNEEVPFGGLKLSDPIGYRFDRGAIGGWTCPLLSGSCWAKDCRSTLIQCLFQWKPRPNYEKLSRIWGGPFATATLDDFYEPIEREKPNDIPWTGGCFQISPARDLGLDGREMLKVIMGFKTA